jgi:hypothetical protein
LSHGQSPINTADEGRNALRLGKHPNVNLTPEASMIDALIPEFDKALRAVFASAPTRRRCPAPTCPKPN